MFNYKPEYYEGQFLVVETDSDAYVGTVRDNGDGTISVLSGFRGRPAIIDVTDVLSMLPPSQSELVDA